MWRTVDKKSRCSVRDWGWKMSHPKKIVIISDGTGKTAKRLMDAVLSQYSQNEVDFTLENIYQQVRDKESFDAIISSLNDEYLVILSIISEEFIKYCREELTKRSILQLNILEPMLETMSKFLGVHPDYKPGILQIIDDRYYKKVDAIGYTVEHDDGRGLLIEDADIVLLGLSRTCKTPISMYLACNYGMKVANIPVVADPTLTQNLIERLSCVRQSSIFGLMMQPEALAQAREERAFFLARTASPLPFIDDLQRYYDLQEIRSEHRFCRDFFERAGWPTIDVTRRAIEEISLEILDRLNART